MRTTYRTLFLLLISVLSFQCRKEVSYVGSPDNGGGIVVPEPVITALQGNIFDENGNAAAGVVVNVGNKTATSNAKGYFRINEATLDKKSSLVTASKAGYFKAYRSFAATSGANQVVIKLIKKSLAGSIDATTGGNITLSNGSKVSLPANSVVNAATSAVYSGSINVYAAYIDPSANDIAQTVPGSFMATDKDGKRVTLTSYGMLAVALENASGEKLQIKTGASATLTTAIPSSLQAAAPATIALWSVDENTGIWKEEGSATKSGNVYVGEAKHFSFWNCDVSAKAIVLSVTLKANGEPLANAEVKIRRVVGSWAVSGWTDSIGQVSGYVPNNESLILDVMDACHTSVYSQNIGPYLENTNLGVINISSSGTSFFTVKGKLLNCNNIAVTNGFAIVGYGNFTHYASVTPTGDFQTTFTRCSSSAASVDIVGVDKGGQQQSSAATSITVMSPITTAGAILSCGTSTTQYINYTLDGTNYSISSAVAGDSLEAVSRDTLPNGTGKITTFSGSQMGGPNQIYMSFQYQSYTNGVYPSTTVSAQNFGPANSRTLPFDITLTNFAQRAGEFYEGSFTGSYSDQSGIVHTLSGNFKLRRLR